MIFFIDLSICIIVLSLIHSNTKLILVKLILTNYKKKDELAVILAIKSDKQERIFTWKY